MIRKFMDETLDAVQFIGEYDFKEFRYGEVLLILAEALYEKNGQITDEQLDLTINDLRNRANMPRLTNAFVATNGLNMQEEIRRERTVELAFEGYRPGRPTSLGHGRNSSSPCDPWREIRGYGVSTEIPGVGDRAGYTGG